MKTTYTVNSTEAAWQLANKIIPTDYLFDAAASERAGYPVYNTTSEDPAMRYVHINDLCARLEVVLPDYTCVNIYIDEQAEQQSEQPAEEEADDVAAYAAFANAVYDHLASSADELSAEGDESQQADEVERATAAYMQAVAAVSDIASAAHVLSSERAELVTLCISGYSWDAEKNRRAYAALAALRDDDERRLAASEYVSKYLSSAGIEWAMMQILSYQRFTSRNGGHVVIQAMYTLAEA